MLRTPDLSDADNVSALRFREPPYWNILEFCRHIGVQKRVNGRHSWLARVRLKSGRYRQCELGPVGALDREGLSYADAVGLAKEWFARPEISAISSSHYPKGVNRTLRYVKTVDGFTVGNAMADYVEWKRVSGARTHFETNLSLVNYHIIPRLGDCLVEDFTSRRFTQFCVEVLESSPKRGRRAAAPDTPMARLSQEALRKRKKTLNTLVGILRHAFRMAWENGEVDSERAWRCLKRLPHADTPRPHFLTRGQCKRLIAACRPDLALLVKGALYSGCRVSELGSLRVRDVGGHFFGLFIQPMKSFRSRYVHLPEEGMSFFLDQCEGRSDDEPVFRMESGRNWSGNHKHLFKEAVLAAGLPEAFVFHGLRHTYASQLVQAGTPLAIVAKQLGHATTDTVSRTYGHLSCASIEEELSRRFAPLTNRRDDPRLSTIRTSLQSHPNADTSWPLRNYSQATGELVQFLRGHPVSRHGGSNAS